MIPLFDHQKRIIDDDPTHTLLGFGTGTGKSLLALTLARGYTLIVCEKQGRDDQTFERNLTTFDIQLDIKVVSKEDFRKNWMIYGGADTLIIDEADNFFGILPDTIQRKGVQIAKTSQMHDALVAYLAKYQPMRFYMLSATPASKPMHVFAIARLLGKNWNYTNFRSVFYTQVKMGYRSIWLPKKDQSSKDRLAESLLKLGYFGALSSFFDVPPQTFIEKYVELTKAQKDEIRHLQRTVADPMALRTALRSIENGVRYDAELVTTNDRVDHIVRKTIYYDTEKIPLILKYAEEFPKLLIFADYIGQIEAIEKSLTDQGYHVLTLTGATKDRKTLLEDAEKLEKCIIVCSARISAGWEWKSCPTVIHASKSNRHRNYNQSLGRVQRADAIKKNLYISLITKGGMDEACHKTILAGEDFQEKIMTNTV